MASTNEAIPVSQEDYLDEDKPLRGQNYVCLSFISPEDVMIDKNVFFFNKYIESFSNDLTKLFDGLRAKYPDENEVFDLLMENNSHFFNQKELQEQYVFYKSINSSDLEAEFHKAQNYRPTIRGIKVRGTFDTLKEAQTRAEVLKRMGDKFDIFVAQVGCWCPWSPNPNDLQDQEYAETGLNTLMKKYKDNIESKEVEYGQRKQEKMEKIAKENEKRRVAAAEADAAAAATASGTASASETGEIENKLNDTTITDGSSSA
jgi:Family of unknown function (DUF5832)